FLTARPEVRAARRAAEVGIDAVEAVESDLLRRDRLDTGRESSPLKKADDAVEIDTSELGIDEVIARILVEVEARR
ncbi:MAG: (d)CMP kinase, partial [Acidimicrobiia bacterium]|nr:(d)CMP kinase [Acidimicrobiia bacterium]